MSETAESPQSTLANLPEYSVSELSAALKRAVEERFPFVRVRGEISGLKAATSGHIYFDLKDDKALLNAIVWRATAPLLKVKPEPGLDVICTGRVTTYPGSSRYQLIVEQMELAGLGALMAMLEERKKRLAAEGLFDAGRKKALPFLPQVIGVITSPTGAVIRDIMHRLNARFSRRVLIWPVAVQGERAAAEIAAAIDGFNGLATDFPRPDLLIVARGGGSIEDLMAFNEESVVRAAAASRIPLISAVGHETDTTLIDFASDMRAPTPTAAAELAVPVLADLQLQLADLGRRTRNCFDKGLSDRRRHLTQLARVLPRPEQLFAASRQRLDQAGERLGLALGRNLHIHRARLVKAASLLRPRPIINRILHARERVANLAARALRSGRVHLTKDRARLESLARVLPRPEQLFAASRQRLDQAGERLGLALGRNLHIHRARLVKAASLLRPRPIINRILHARERVANLAARALRSERVHLTKDRARLESLARVLEGMSYRSVLERGFALVKGADGKLRRRAAQIKPGDHLHLTFADGDSAVLADGGAKHRVKKPGGDQGSLF